MKISITPSVAQGVISAPPSKSVAHRLLICAALSNGVSTISNIGTNDDILATLSCLESLGARVQINNDTATVTGVAPTVSPFKEFFCNESGSTLRFMIPVALLFADECRFTGRGRLMERPQSVYQELFGENGCYLTLRDDGIYAGGSLKSGTYKIRGDVSSQFITGLMLALPLLSGDSEILLTTPLESAPYVDLTIGALKAFGVEVKPIPNGYFIKGNQQYTPQNLSVEGDWSNAAFLDAFNLAGGSVEVKNVEIGSFQGDKVYRDYYSQFFAGVPAFDISQCPDLGPVLMIGAVIKNGARLTGTGRLKIKESDRGAVMAQELEKFGVHIEIGEDYIVIPKCEPQKPTQEINCHNDHRIAMAFSVLCSVTGGVLNGAQCVNKSYPDFFMDIKSLGIQFEIL